MKIYKAEKEAGLADQLKGSGRLSFASVAKAANVSFPVSERIKISAALRAGSKAVASETDPDLYALNSVLVSTGWNLNDAVFVPQEMWGARHTPEDKPFNYEHNNSDIIGHMTGCKVIGSDGNEILDDTSVDEVPTLFDIHTSAVLYKRWDDEKLQERMDKILAEIEEGKWFVSMECLFPNFDYATIDEDGTQKIIGRNGKTAFLTKHLKFYGGTGVYNGSRVGMVLRDFIFSGKGLVLNPANPASLIYPFDTAKAQFYTSAVDAGYQTLSEPSSGNKIMEKELADAKTALTAAQEAQKAAEALVEAAKVEAAAAKVASDKAIADAVAENTKTLETVKALEAEKVEAAKVLAETNKTLSEAKTKIVELTRTEKVIAKGLTKEEATKWVANSLAQTDEQFDASLELVGSLAQKASKTKLPEHETNTPVVEVPAKETAAAVVPAPTGGAENVPSASKSLAAKLIKKPVNAGQE